VGGPVGTPVTFDVVVCDGYGNRSRGALPMVRVSARRLHAVEGLEPEAGSLNPRLGSPRCGAAARQDGAGTTAAALVDAEPSAPVLSHVGVEDTGELRATYRVLRSGRYEVEVDVAGVPLSGSPFYATFTAAALAAPNCAMRGAGLSRAMAGVANLLEISA